MLDLVLYENICVHTHEVVPVVVPVVVHVVVHVVCIYF